MPRTCLTCSLTDAEVAFPKRRSYCKPCWNLQQAAYRAGRPEKNGEYRERYKPVRARHHAENAEKIAAQVKAYRETHKEEIRAWEREYQQTPTYKEKREHFEETHRDHLLAYLARYNAERREALRPYMREYQRTYGAARRSLQADAIADLSPEQWAEILHVFGHRCAYCDRKVPMSQDHLTPVIQQGAYTVHNIVPACRSCNSKKKDDLSSNLSSRFSSLSPLPNRKR